MTWAVYGHGSHFAGLPDASDVDVLVVTDLPMTWRQAAGRVTSLDALAAARLAGLPLDLTVEPPAQVRADPMLRAAVLAGVLLDGEPFHVEPFAPAEWGDVMRAVAALPTCTPGARVLTELRALWASQGRVVLPKSAVPGAARGGEHEAVAADAWQRRHSSGRATTAAGA